MPIQSLSEDEIQALLAAERDRCAAVVDQENAKASYNVVKHGAHGHLRKYFMGRAHAAEIVASRIRNLPPQTEGGQT